MIVALNIDNIVEEIEYLDWYNQNFNFDFHQDIKNNTLSIYVDWTLEDQKAAFIPFVHVCGRDNYYQTIKITLTK